jgi:Transposase and inactivated derivatives, IS30 family
VWIRKLSGKEFSFHEKIAEELNISIYFAKPYHSWERGANENTNGLIRQYFPKCTDFGDITPEQVMHLQNILNSRPRKR